MEERGHRVGRAQVRLQDLLLGQGGGLVEGVATVGVRLYRDNLRFGERDAEYIVNDVAVLVIGQQRDASGRERTVLAAFGHGGRTSRRRLPARACCSTTCAGWLARARTNLTRTTKQHRAGSENQGAGGTCTTCVSHELPLVLEPGGAC